METNIFAQKKSLILGGTSGIGLEISKILCDFGSSVTAIGRKLPKIEKKINFIQFDLENFLNLKNPQEFEQKFNLLLKPLLENTDFFVYVVGPFVQKSLEQTSSSDWQSLAFFNYVLPGMCLSSLLKSMKERKFGRIVFFGGTRTENVRSYKTNAAYASSKTALSVLVKSAASEYSEFGITCNAILPGFTRNAPKNTKLVSEVDLAQKTIFLLENENLNGVLLNVDRGWNP